ncbi:alpha/beta fold hydrolase [Chromobacterium alticapitis]|uniref:Alpha/beta hydrolase n=1 Tax=Chromobacterium alticapitis TaxID=2073169 RepID=A0A2S5DFW1_9NEIS|nr:alpha/beta hydrolase [Chromobacterium alticapitis]POZ61995.1 alpha/beta hydrolase [Chromobacterium alticapitis]
MAKISLSEGEIDYLLIDGAAELPPLVLLHEGLGCIAMWRRFPHRLAEMTGRRVLAYSRYGYGYSSAAQLPRRVDYMHVEALQVLPELLRRLELREPVLVGHSDGASIALLHASVFPVAGLALLAPHVFVEDITLAGIEAARQSFASGELERQLALFHRDPRTVFEGWSGVWLSERFRGWNIEECLVNIHCRALLLQGDGDEYGTLAQLDAIRLGMRGVAVQHCLDDCGHSPHLQQPERALGLVAGFITQLTDAASRVPELQ